MRLAAVTVDGRRLAAVERDGDLYALAVPAGTDLAAVLTAGPAAVREAVSRWRRRPAGSRIRWMMTDLTGRRGRSLSSLED